MSKDSLGRSMSATSSDAKASQETEPVPTKPPSPEATARALLCADADVTFRCKDQQEVAAHRLMLRLSSSVWRGLVDSTECSTIPADEDSADDMEMLLCLLYPVVPKPQLSLDNVEQLARLAYKYDVQRVLSECDTYLQTLTFTVTQPTATVHLPWEADTKHAIRWLKLGSDWGMPLVVDKSIEALTSVLKAQQRRAQCGRQHQGTCVYNASSGGWCTLPVHGLQPFVCGNAFLSGLSHAALIKLVKAAATWAP